MKINRRLPMMKTILTLLLCFPLIITLMEEAEEMQAKKWPVAQEKITIPQSIYLLAINDT